MASSCDRKAEEYSLEGVVGDAVGSFIPVIGPVFNKYDGFRKEPLTDTEAIERLTLFAEKLKTAGVRQLVATGEATIDIGFAPNPFDYRKESGSQRLVTVQTYIGIK